MLESEVNESKWVQGWISRSEHPTMQQFDKCLRCSCTHIYIYICTSRWAAYPPPNGMVPPLPRIICILGMMLAMLGMLSSKPNHPATPPLTPTLSLNQPKPQTHHKPTLTTPPPQGAGGLGGGGKIVKGEFKELFFLLFFLHQQHNKQKTKSRTTSKQNK